MWSLQPPHTINMVHRGLGLLRPPAKACENFLDLKIVNCLNLLINALFTLAVCREATLVKVPSTCICCLSLFTLATRSNLHVSIRQSDDCFAPHCGTGSDTCCLKKPISTPRSVVLMTPKTVPSLYRTSIMVLHLPTEQFLQIGRQLL
jgi:hypothetical protein